MTAEEFEPLFKKETSKPTLANSYQEFIVMRLQDAPASSVLTPVHELDQGIRLTSKNVVL